MDSICRKQVSAQGRSRTSPVGTAGSQSCPNWIFSISRRGQHSQKTSQRSRQIANQSRRDGRGEPRTKSWVPLTTRNSPVGTAQSILSQLDFLDQQAWTAFAENKSALKADREPVP